MVLDVAGNKPQQLTFEPGKSWPYDFSPDGDKVVFARLRDGTWNIWWVSRSSLEQRQLTHFNDLGGYVRYPAWAPSGERVVFERARSAGDLWMVEGLSSR
jgi:Tol biopolymer transport system component